MAHRLAICVKAAGGVQNPQIASATSTTNGTKVNIWITDQSWVMRTRSLCLRRIPGNAIRREFESLESFTLNSRLQRDGLRRKLGCQRPKNLALRGPNSDHFS